MKTNKYFVSYQFTNTNNPNKFGFGCIELELIEKVKGYTEIKDMTSYIKQTLKTSMGQDTNVVILYWRPFEEQIEVEDNYDYK